MAVTSRSIEAAGVHGPGRRVRLRQWWEQEQVGSPGPFVGLANFREILANDVFRQTILNSFVFTSLALTLKTVLGVWLAVLLARDVRGKRLLRGAVLLPWVIPTALSTLGWWWMFDSLYSVVNWTAIRLGLMNPPGPNWLGQSAWAMAAVVIVNTWRGLPFFAIMVLAGLMAIPREFYEAAEVDGASQRQRFWHVTMPLLKPVLAVVVLFSTIFTFSDFSIVHVLTRGGPVNTTHLFATLAYQIGLQGGNLGPFSTWLLMGYFRTVPREVEECALVDGATRMQTLWKIVLPMAVPGVVCAALFGFTLCWNEFIYALTFVSQSGNKTAVVGVTAELIRGDIYYWGSLMAGAVLASVPIVVIYVWFLDYYVSGLTAGAVKG